MGQAVGGYTFEVKRPRKANGRSETVGDGKRSRREPQERRRDWGASGAGEATGVAAVRGDSCVCESL